jgi:hypothetical protein
MDEATEHDEARLDVDDFPGSPADAPVSDEDLDALVLFAGVAPADVERHAAELRQVLGGEG